MLYPPVGCDRMKPPRHLEFGNGDLRGRFWSTGDFRVPEMGLYTTMAGKNISHWVKIYLTTRCGGCGGGGGVIILMRYLWRLLTTEIPP